MEICGVRCFYLYYNSMGGMDRLREIMDPKRVLVCLGDIINCDPHSNGCSLVKTSTRQFPTAARQANSRHTHFYLRVWGLWIHYFSQPIPGRNEVCMTQNPQKRSH